MKTTIAIITLLLSLQVHAEEYEDMCNFYYVPDEILDLQPQLSDFTDSDKAANRKAYQQASDAYDKKYKKEFDRYKRENEAYENSISASQNKFYEISAANWKKHDKLMNEIKSVCWIEIMGIDEREKDDMCNPLERPLDIKDWNNLSICTVERAILLGVELYKYK